MIVSKIIGGLGNQMFQYAAGRALALRLGVDLFVDTRSYISYKTNPYGLSCFIANLKEGPKHILPDSTPNCRLQRWFFKSKNLPLSVFDEKSFSFDPDVLNLPDNYYLNGYFQSEKYFIDYKNEIRFDFSIKYPPSQINKKILDELQVNNSVSIHIRRGDYVSNPSCAAIHGTCNLSYYEKAVLYITNCANINPVLYVFSDDIEWARVNFRLPFQTIFVSGNDSYTNYEDLRLMSACQHHVIANSSFSWWAAWLDTRPDAITVAPRIWFATTDLDTTDLIPLNWIRL